MKLGHAAALAVIGWYLMIPPHCKRHLPLTLAADIPARRGCRHWASVRSDSLVERGEFELPVPIVNSQGRQCHGPSAIEGPLAYDAYQVCKAGLLAASAKAAKALDGAVRRDPVALPPFPGGEPALLRRP
jgi:hypothetical protein